MNELARNIAKITTGEGKKPDDDEGMNPSAVALGWLGGMNSGRARAKKLSLKRRSEIARIAAAKRWKKEE